VLEEIPATTTHVSRLRESPQARPAALSPRVVSATPASLSMSFFHSSPTRSEPGSRRQGQRLKGCALTGGWARH